MPLQRAASSRRFSHAPPPTPVEEMDAVNPENNNAEFDLSGEVLEVEIGPSPVPIPIPNLASARKSNKSNIWYLYIFSFYRNNSLDPMYKYSLGNFGCGVGGGGMPMP